MLDRKFYVYVHMKKTDDSVFYVGKGCNNRYLKTQGRNQYWDRVVAKYGFVAEIVQSNLTFEEANEAEIRLIKELREQGCQLCNLTDGGEGAKGWKKTSEQIEHHRFVTTGMKRSEESKAKMKGRKFSKEALQKIGCAQKGKIVSEETKNKMSLAATKRKASDETKAKISAAHKGKQHRKGAIISEETRKKTSESLKKTLAAKKLAKATIALASSHKELQNVG
jgi:NUMOD3 motif